MSFNSTHSSVSLCLLTVLSSVFYTHISQTFTHSSHIFHLYTHFLYKQLSFDLLHTSCHEYHYLYFKHMDLTVFYTHGGLLHKRISLSFTHMYVFYIYESQYPLHGSLCHLDTWNLLFLLHLIYNKIAKPFPTHFQMILYCFKTSNGLTDCI